MAKKFDIYDAIDLIRPRPGMIIGKHSLSYLKPFLDGYSCFGHWHGIEMGELSEFHKGFHDWVAERFGWNESTAG